MAERAQRRTVLLADDDVKLRRATAGYLREHGFEVVEVENGLEAQLLVNQLRPVAVVLDLMMPRLGGLDALKRIRALDPTITVVVMTRVEDPELHRQALALGAARAFLKPVVPDDLAAVLASPEKSPGGAAAPRVPSPTPGGEPAGIGRVLVVDDEAQTRAMLTELITQQGYRVRTAADGAAAVRAVLDMAPDVVLLDIAMPGLGGIEALTAIRAIAPEVKVIMVSGLGNLDLAKRALAYGAFDYVTKPVDPAYLTVSLQVALAWKGLTAG